LVTFREYSLIRRWVPHRFAPFSYELAQCVRAVTKVAGNVGGIAEFDPIHLALSASTKVGSHFEPKGFGWFFEFGSKLLWPSSAQRP
jgi:hypothetical protein